MTNQLRSAILRLKAANARLQEPCPTGLEGIEETLRERSEAIEALGRELQEGGLDDPAASGDEAGGFHARIEAAGLAAYLRQELEAGFDVRRRLILLKDGLLAELLTTNQQAGLAAALSASSADPQAYDLLL